MSEPRRFDVVGTGSMVVDVIHLVPRIIGAEEKLLVESTSPSLSSGSAQAPVRRLVGGVTLNHLGWARILGARVALFGKQADDANGRLLRDGMRRLGLHHDIDLSGSASSCADVFVGSAGERAIYMLRGATSELTPGDVDARFAPLIRSGGIFTTEVSQVPLAVVVRALEVARDAHVRTVVDLDLPEREVVPTLGTRDELERVLELADVIKPAEVALTGLVAQTDPERAAHELAGRYDAICVAVTLGEKGAVVWADGESRQVPASRVRPVDTTGAGDAFLGGLVAGMHLGLDWERAAVLGNACGAACCEQVGAFPDDPDACRARVVAHLRTLESDVSLPSVDVEAAGAADALERFLEIAPQELAGTAARVPAGAVREVAQLILEAERKGGRVHVTGVGKPEHVAHYAASLLSSTGTPATFLHATEAIHGSVGQLRPDDVVIAISNSGETRELLDTVAAARGLDVAIVAVVARADSSLGREADRVLEARVDHEGGPLGLAPRASVLAQTLLLQALSVELQAARELTREAYGLRHPAGRLGELSRRR